MEKSLSSLFVFSVLLFACARTDIATQIADLEQSLAASYTTEKADSLIALYRAAEQQYPDRHADNLHYMTRVADLKFTRYKENVTAVRFLNDALKNHGNGQDISEPIGVLARIWLVYRYKATSDLSAKPDDVDLMYANLMKNMDWIDSNLVRLERTMSAQPILDKTMAESYIQIAEGYSTLVDGEGPNKYADLMLRAARIAKNVGEPNKAVQLYYRIGEKIPWHPQAPVAFFEMARVYENDMKDVEKAKATYQDILRLYPKNPEFADAARTALNALGDIK